MVSSGSISVTPSTPTPISPADRKPSSVVQVDHIAGCGFCRGFGMTERSLILMSSPSQENRSLVHIWATIRIASTCCRRVSSGSIWKVRHSGIVDRAKPISRRPPLR